MPDQIQVIDSHTAGEPTRIIVDGGPDLGSGPLSDRVKVFRHKFDDIRRAVVMEPRGSDVLVGGLLLEPTDSASIAGIIFFNNQGYLGMCGHGTIGLMSTLKYLGRIDDGSHTIETPVGNVTAVIEGHQTTIQNVPSYRLLADVKIEVPEVGEVIGDVAWGGNWFFLVKQPSYRLDAANVDQLTRTTLMIRQALSDQGITGLDGAWIDHIELFGTPAQPSHHSRNFVLCPGGAYDRSPCGTGTSAKLACLAADGKLEPGQNWYQESVIGSTFTGSYQPGPDQAGTPSIIPTISGTAFVTGEAKLILNPDDPFCLGIPS